MTNDTQPPVGATVTDADGMQYECDRHIPTRWAKWRCERSRIECDAATDDALTALWRMQQERDQLKARVADLERQIDEEHDTDETLLGALITATLCRLPAEVVGDGDWERYREEHGKKWLGDHRAFGGWLSGRITDALTQLKEKAMGWESHASQVVAYNNELQARVAELGKDAARWRVTAQRFGREFVFVGGEHTRFFFGVNGRYETLGALADEWIARDAAGAARAARGGAAPFDPEWNCPTHFAAGDPTCPACIAKQPRAQGGA